MRKYLKEIREKANLSQQDVANKLNITRQYYNQIENGERQQNMDVVLASKLADLFGISVSYIVEQEMAGIQSE